MSIRQQTMQTRVFKKYKLNEPINTRDYEEWYGRRHHYSRDGLKDLILHLKVLIFHARYDMRIKFARNKLTTTIYKFVFPKVL
jgi:hypothetical protein